MFITDPLRDMQGPGTGHLSSCDPLTSEEFREGRISDTWEGESCDAGWLSQAGSHRGNSGVSVWDSSSSSSVSCQVCSPVQLILKLEDMGSASQGEVGMEWKWRHLWCSHEEGKKNVLIKLEAMLFYHLEFLFWMYWKRIVKQIRIQLFFSYQTVPSWSKNDLAFQC